MVLFYFLYYSCNKNHKGNLNPFQKESEEVDERLENKEKYLCWELNWARLRHLKQRQIICSQFWRKRRILLAIYYNNVNKQQIILTLKIRSGNFRRWRNLQFIEWWEKRKGWQNISHYERIGSDNSNDEVTWRKSWKFIMIWGRFYRMRLRNSWPSLNLNPK